MIQVTVLYGHPQDPAAFDRYYRETHVPLGKALPGLKGYTASKPTSLNPQEPSPYYLIVDLYFDNAQAVQSPQGQAAAGDLQNFATGGATLLSGEVQVYDPVSIN